MVLKLQGAERMRDALNGIGQRVRVVVHRVDAPVVARAVVLGVANPVQRRVPHIQVGRRHVDFGAQHVLAVGELAGPHPAEQVQVFLNRTIPVRAFPPRFRQRAPILAHLVGGQAVNVGVAVPNQLLGVLVQLLKVVRCVVQVLVPIEAQPLDVRQYGLHVFDVLAGRVRVVKPHVAARPGILLAHAEVQADGLGVPDVQIAIGLRRKAGHHPPVVSPGRLILGDDAANEIVGNVPGGRGLTIAHFPLFDLKDSLPKQFTS